jgi:hypothetical protein
VTAVGGKIARAPKGSDGLAHQVETGSGLFCFFAPAKRAIKAIANELRLANPSALSLLRDFTKHRFGHLN